MEGVNRKLVRQTQLFRYPCIIVMSCFESISIYHVASMNFLSLFFKIISIIILLVLVPSSKQLDHKLGVSKLLGGRASKGAVFTDFRLELLAHWPGFGPGNRLQHASTVPFRHRMFSLRNRQSES